MSDSRGQVGRNDHCPCGSGKKYKHCHWDQDLAARQAAVPPPPAPPPPAPRPAAPSAFAELTALDDLDPAKANVDVRSPAYWDKLHAQMPRELRRELGPVVKQVRQYAQEQTYQAAFTAAEALEPYRAEFERLAKTPTKLFARAEKVFAEEPFADLRFHAADVQRAFAAVGFPVPGGSERDYLICIEKAIRWLVDAAQGEALALRLAERLPDYVAAERHLDGWIVWHSLDLMIERPADAVGPFLLAMFFHGLREWETARYREQDALLASVGLDVEEVQRLGYEGTAARLQQLLAKPSQAATVEKFVAQHPELNALSQAQCREAERAAVALLDREDAGDLLLTPDEVAPWIPELSRRLLAVPKLMASVASQKPPNPKLTQAFFELLYQLGREMATAIFTPARQQQLAEEVLAYRRRLDPAQQQELLPGVPGALTAAHSDAAPAENHFLVSLCCKSLMVDIRDMEAEASAEGQTP